MAKRNIAKATIDLTGVSIDQIMNLDIDINKLSRGDLSRVVGRLVSASNKRIRNLAKTEIGQLSPAYQSRMERGGLFSTKGKNVNQLRHMFAETKGFLQLRTSSVSKWNSKREEIVQNLEKNISEKYGTKVDLSELLTTDTKSKKFWKTYREFSEGKAIPDKHTSSRYNSERIQELIAVQYEKESGFGGFGQKRSDVIEILNQKFDELYEEEQSEEMNIDSSPEEVDQDDDFDIRG